MVRFWSLILIFILTSSAGWAQGSQLEDYPIYRLDVILNITSNQSVIYKLDITLSKTANNTLNYTLNTNATNISVSDGVSSLPFNITETGGSRILEIELNGTSKTIIIGFEDDQRIFQKDSVNFLFAELPFTTRISKVTVKANLPEGMILNNKGYTPDNAAIMTDGRRISVFWDRTNPVPPYVYTVEYLPAQEIVRTENKSDFSIFWAIATGIIFVIFSAAVVSIIIHYKMLTKKEFLKGFRKDEQKAIQYLQENKVVWQNTLQHNFNFSRAKSTRIVKRLEAKGILKKESHGRTNKLYWVKK